MARALLLGAVLLTAGCYVYVPVDRAQPSPGEQVRVLIHPEAARRLGAESGRTLDRVDGRLVGLQSDSVTVSVWAGPEYRGTPFERMRRNFTLGGPEVLEIQRRQLSRERTAITAVGVTAVLGFAVGKILSSRGKAEGSLPDPGPPAPALGRR